MKIQKKIIFFGGGGGGGGSGWGRQGRCDRRIEVSRSLYLGIEKQRSEIVGGAVRGGDVNDEGGQGE